MTKVHREYNKLGRRYGYRLHLTKRGHPRLVREGYPFVVVSASASDVRAIKNVESELRKATRKHHD